MYDQEIENERHKCLCRNALVHAVIWPLGDDPQVTLIDADGVIQGIVPISEPTKGQHFNSMVPQGYSLEVQDCSVVSMSGKLLVTTVGEFDTAVVTERAELTFEERMQRLERREQRRMQLEQKRQRETDELRKQLAERDRDREREGPATLDEEAEEAPSQDDQEGADDGE